MIDFKHLYAIDNPHILSCDFVGVLMLQRINRQAQTELSELSLPAPSKISNEVKRSSARCSSFFRFYGGETMTK
jgi:hypothetical protein